MSTARGLPLSPASPLELGPYLVALAFCAFLAMQPKWLRVPAMPIERPPPAEAPFGAAPEISVAPADLADSWARAPGASPILPDESRPPATASPAAPTAAAGSSTDPVPPEAAWGGGIPSPAGARALVRTKSPHAPAVGHTAVQPGYERTAHRPAGRAAPAQRATKAPPPQTETPAERPSNRSGPAIGGTAPRGPALGGPATAQRTYPRIDGTTLRGRN
jgi:hypothetical protein